MILVRMRELLRERETRATGLTLALLLAAILLPALSLPRATYTYLAFFDISQSMNVEDYELDGRPASRLAFARRALADALREMPCGSRVGLGAFTEYRTLLLMAPMEVCGNYHELLVALGYVDGGMRWADSSEVTKGVFWSIRAARELGGDSRIVFLTDGHEAPPMRATGVPVFSDIKPGAVPGWIIGVGKDTPQAIPRIDREGNRVGYWRAEDVVQVAGASPEGSAAQGREHLSSLREPHLRALAQQVGFDYARLERASSLRVAMLDSRYAQRRPVPTDLYWLPAVLALLCLALQFRPRLKRKTGR